MEIIFPSRSRFSPDCLCQNFLLNWWPDGIFHINSTWLARPARFMGDSRSNSKLSIQKCRKIRGLGCVNQACTRARVTQPSPPIFLHICTVWNEARAPSALFGSFWLRTQRYFIAPPPLHPNGLSLTPFPVHGWCDKRRRVIWVGRVFTETLTLSCWLFSTGFILDQIPIIDGPSVLQQKW